MSPSSRRTILALVAVGSTLMLCLCAVTLSGVGFWLWSRGQEAVEVSAPTFSAQEQQPADEVIGTDLDGVAWTASELAGKPYVINFWASWCGPCAEELPVIEELSREYAEQGVIVLLVNDRESEAVARDYATLNDLTLPIIPDPSGVLSDRYRVQGLPTTLMYDETGELKARILGYNGKDFLRRGFERIVD